MRSGQFPADRAVDANRVREALVTAGIEPVSPPNSTRRLPARFDRHTCTSRHPIENFFAKL